MCKGTLQSLRKCLVLFLQFGVRISPFKTTRRWTYLFVSSTTASQTAGCEKNRKRILRLAAPLPLRKWVDIPASNDKDKYGNVHPPFLCQRAAPVKRNVELAGAVGRLVGSMDLLMLVSSLMEATRFSQYEKLT